ncbi:nuclear transcription factor Y subunit B-9 isoform X2 [Ricinus communis]|uniref:Ccaat-binding transcription factor subunit A, putative n=1 Tax=Ricinus communis TaxID=3988 RepID=B9S9S1_RICCO|nr:nuclear transcription factor Y subunit B-9 isoform X2 [Ricinus communis]EEF39591.1 ccaat-binding transcription factor subunit A, putative [Ricinus communis]|eukprot:XP_002522740.1 nuclear transcription factor Y subunit B-9 [Ricinus communis]
MERGGRVHRYRRHAKQPTPTTSATASTSPGMSSVQTTICSNINLPSTLSLSNSTAAPQAPQQQQLQPSQCLVREQDQYMPIANVIRIMRRILPPHAKISDDAKETIQECVSEYISFITGEANDRCQREQRKTITAEDVLWAMGKLGFDDYVEPLTLFLNRYREMENERSTIRDPILKRSSVGVVDYGNLGMNPFMPTFPMIPPPQGYFDSNMLGGYYRDAPDGASGAASGSNLAASSAPNSLLHFDPFAQFK